MNTLQKAEIVLVDARKQLLAIVEEIGEGKRDGKNSATVSDLLKVSTELGNATTLMFASDSDLCAVHSIDIH